MSVTLYMDVHIRLALTEGLRLRGVDVLTAQEDEATELDDFELLDRATSLGRVLVTHDKDFLREASERQQSGQTFAGIIYAHQIEMTIGECLNDLELIAKGYEPEDLINRLEYLPLK
jgi:predicted nuclease of predicted toxin-antitoxin system